MEKTKKLKLKKIYEIVKNSDPKSVVKTRDLKDFKVEGSSKEYKPKMADVPKTKKPKRMKIKKLNKLESERLKTNKMSKGLLKSYIETERYKGEKKLNKKLKLMK